MVSMKLVPANAPINAKIAATKQEQYVLALHPVLAAATTPVRNAHAKRAVPKALHVTQA